MTAEHKPVMLREVLEGLNVRPGRRYIDGTAGAGGHSRAIMDAAQPGGSLLAMDKDPEALERAREQLDQFGDSVHLVQGDYATMGDVCRELDFAPVDGVLLDLGLSSLQLEASERGFSFQGEGPLDMRFDPEQELTADEIVNQYDERQLTDIIQRFGEEPRARRIARHIIERRPVHTTTQLAKVVEEAVGGRARRQSHPATRTFQALRIAVNQELLSLTDALPQAYGLLGDLGRLAVLSYHSLEDRIVKSFIQRESRDCICPPRQPACTCGHKAGLRPVSRGAIKPTAEEVADNPRSRSARLRVAERLPTPA
jgi:16S rRNA (cytosine1402-N4)-methyltransferase